MTNSCTPYRGNLVGEKREYKDACFFDKTAVSIVSHIIENTLKGFSSLPSPR
jgi:hypothetical protein